MADGGRCPYCGRSDVAEAAMTVLTRDLRSLLDAMTAFRDAMVQIEHTALIHVEESERLLRALRERRGSRAH